MPDVPYRVDKPWGYELIWARTDRYVGKVLHVKAGHVLSLQYHNKKDETMHVLSGELILRTRPGDVLEDARLPGRRLGAHPRRPGAPDRGGGGQRRARGVHAGTRRPGPPLGPLRAEQLMQVIIPLAGKGTRLRPHTHLVPKPMLKVAGRPVMDWVMDRLEGLDGDGADLHHRPP